MCSKVNGNFNGRHLSRVSGRPVDPAHLDAFSRTAEREAFENRYLADSATRPTPADKWDTNTGQYAENQYS